MALLLLLSLTSVVAFEDSLLQANDLSGVGARRYGTWGAQKFKWNVTSKVSKYFMTQNDGHNQTTSGQATLNTDTNTTISTLTTKGGVGNETKGAQASMSKVTETVKPYVAPGGLLQKKDGISDQIGSDAGTFVQSVHATEDKDNLDKWNATNSEVKSTADTNMDTHMEVAEDNNRLTDLEYETPQLTSNRDGYVKSNWTSTDKYTTWAAIGILERMIDRAVADPYQRNADGTPAPKGMAGTQGHPGLVGKFDAGSDPSPTDDTEFLAADGH